MYLKRIHTNPLSFCFSYCHVGSRLEEKPGKQSQMAAPLSMVTATCLVKPMQLETGMHIVELASMAEHIWTAAEIGIFVLTWMLAQICIAAETRMFAQMRLQVPLRRDIVYTGLLKDLNVEVN